MDGRTLGGKTLTFAVICVFMAVFLLLFGTRYALLGITVSSAAMLMLSKDLSSRPFSNLAILMVFMVFMGLGAFAASLDPFLGLAVNFAVVFVVVFVSMQDLRSPMHFPMLLFYASMVTLPVTLEEMPDRLLVLAVSAVFIVALNVMVNRGSRVSSSHRGVIAICDEISRCADEVLDGGEPSVADLGRLCTDMNRMMYDRLKGNFFTTPRDRRVLDLVVALMDVGRSVCRTERSEGVLRGMRPLMSIVSSHERGEVRASAVGSAVDALLASNPDAGRSTVIALREMARCLESLESGTEGEYGEGRLPTVRAVIRTLREEARRDSARFTFGVRMGLMFALVAFAWSYWGWQNAQWMLFTVVAAVVPYLEDSWRGSMLRLAHTLAGAVAFLALWAVAGYDPLLMLAVGLLAGYAYVVVGTDRYDTRLLFYTILVLVASSMVSPSETLAADRVLFTLAGVFVAVVANRVVLPYRISDENRELAARSLAIGLERIRNIRDMLDGRDDSEEEAGLAIISASVSQKMLINADRDSDPMLRRFMMRQDSLSMQCSSLYRSVPGMSEACRAKVREAMSEDLDSEVEMAEVDVSGLDPYEAECVRRAEAVMDAYRDNRDLMYDIVVSGFMRDRPVATMRVGRVRSVTCRRRSCRTSEGARRSRRSTSRDRR